MSGLGGVRQNACLVDGDGSGHFSRPDALGVTLQGDASVLFESFRETDAFAVGKKTGSAEAGGAQRSRRGARIHLGRSARQPAPAALTLLQYHHAPTRAQDAVSLA